MADKALQCVLCDSTQLKSYYVNKKSQIFWKCLGCQLIFLDPAHRLSLAEEQIRYELHQNNVEDVGYQKFLAPVIECVMEQQSTQDKGLDFGCGPQSVVVHNLRKQDYQIDGYDPLYFPVADLLRAQYDYVVCTEVAEHFLRPLDEFRLLYGLLRAGGHLYLKTALTDNVADFPNWHYHRDPTHVCFYSEATLDFLRRSVGFSRVVFHDKFVVFER